MACNYTEVNKHFKLSCNERLSKDSVRFFSIVISYIYFGLRNSKEFAKQLADYKDDPYLVGYFLRNEPHWAFGYHNLAYEMFGTSQVEPYKDDIIKIPSIHY